MAGGIGEVVFGGAGAACTMAMMLARRALREAARDVHAAQMRRIAMPTWAGDSASVMGRMRPEAVS
jgi:hypothetical protein